MSNQLQLTGGAKVRDLQDVIIGTSGVLSSVAFNVANGVPKLDVNGKILVSQLPNSVMEYKGVWNAATNSPTLTNGGSFNEGDVYLCNVAGTVNFGAGPIAFIVGDSAVYSGSIWQRSGGATGSVTSVGLSTNGGAITIGNSPITTSGTITANFNGTNLQYVNGAGNLTTFPTLITSIGLSMPSAFSVANSPLTANGTIAVTGAGYASQYIRGDGTLADFPSSGGGGSSVSYYLNGGTSQGTIGGTTYYEMSKTADTGTGVDFTKSGDGLIVAFLTDANDPAQLNIPAGNWNYEIYASMSSNGGTPQMYAELYKYDGTTFTLISTSTNEILYDGVNLNLYTFGMTVPATSLTLTDRLAIKLYATNSGGKTTTVHTQDSHLCQVITTFSTGITALNGLTAQVQYFQTGTSGTDFNISSTTATHTFNLPTASATNRGALSSADWSTFNGKENTLTFYSPLVKSGSSVTIPPATSIANGYLTSTDWSTFNSKQAALSGTGFVKISGTTISYDNSTYYLASNPSAFISLTALSAGVGISYNNTTGVITNSAPDQTVALTASTGISVTGTYPNFTITNTSPSSGGTVTSVAALTIGTSGTDLSSSVANSTTTPVITLNVPTASATNRGALSSADWTTFNNKQNALTNPVLASGTWTSGYLPKINGTYTIGNSLVYDNGTNVGVGTASPFGKFNVVDGTNKSFVIQDAGVADTIELVNYSTSGGIRNMAISASTLTFATGTAGGGSATTRLSISSTGAATFSGSLQTNGDILINSSNAILTANNLLISGTARKFQVWNNVSAYIDVLNFASNGAATFSIASGVYTAINITSPNTSVYYKLTPTGGDAYYLGAGVTQTNDFSIYNSTRSAPYLTITGGASGGNVGIGTSSPDQKLTIQAAGTANGLISFKNSAGTTTSFVGVPNANGDVISTSGTADICLRNETGNILFATNGNAEKMRITSGGNVLIGTTTDATGKLQVNGEIRMYGSTLFRGMSSNTLQLCGGTSSSNVKIDGSVEVVTIDTNGATRLTIASSGAATFTGSVTATSFFESSDSRLKTLIQDNYQTKGIASITPKLYTKNGKVELGYYAQDFVGILDSAISKGSDDMLNLSYREVHTAKIYALEQEIKELKAKMN